MSMNSNKQYVKLQVDYKSSVSQAGIPRTMLEVPQEIMTLISMNFGMPQKISTIPQNITGIAVQQLEILTTGNNFKSTNCTPCQQLLLACECFRMWGSLGYEKLFQGFFHGKILELLIQSKKVERTLPTHILDQVKCSAGIHFVLFVAAVNGSAYLQFYKRNFHHHKGTSQLYFITKFQDANFQTRCNYR